MRDPSVAGEWTRSRTSAMCTRKCWCTLCRWSGWAWTVRRTSTVRCESSGRRVTARQCASSATPVSSLLTNSWTWVLTVLAVWCKSWRSLLSCCCCCEVWECGLLPVLALAPAPASASLCSTGSAPCPRDPPRQHESTPSRGGACPQPPYSRNDSMNRL